MTSFNIAGGDKDPEEWAIIAFRKTTENNLQVQVIGGLVIAGFAATAINPVTGLLVGGWILWDSSQKIKNAGKSRVAIRDYGCVAPFLSDDEFITYSRQVISQGNADTLNAELQFAVENGFEISDAALEYLEKRRPHILQNAVLPAQTYIPPTVIQTQSQTHETNYTIDIVREIASPIRNCIIFGIGGSGKGMLVSNALRRIKAENPNRKIFYIDPKNEPGEYGYTEGVVDVVRRKTCDGKQSEEICAWMDEVLDEYTEWANQQEESLLVIDEGTTLGDAAKKCKNTRIGTLILHTASLGGAKRKNVWLMAQSPYVGSLGLELSTTSQIVAVAIISDSNTNALKQWKRSPILEPITQEQLTELLKHSPVKRAVFFGGSSRWGAMPELPNYSAIDRDNNKPTGDALSTEQRQELRQRTQPSQADIIIQKLQATNARTIEDFINEIGCSGRLEEMKNAIASTLTAANRQDLLDKFFPKKLAPGLPIQEQWEVIIGNPIGL